MESVPQFSLVSRHSDFGRFIDFSLVLKQTSEYGLEYWTNPPPPKGVSVCIHSSPTDHMYLQGRPLYKEAITLTSW